MANETAAGADLKLTAREFQQIGDLVALPSRRAAAAARSLHARQHDLIDVQKAILLEADVDERRLESG